MSLIYLNNIQYFTGNNLLSNDRDSFDVYVPDDAILIFGSSALAGQDIHNTPFGSMSGMEVLANGIRSFQITRPPPAPPGAFERFATKLKAIMAALALAMLFDTIIKSLERRRRNIGLSTKTQSKPLWDRFSTMIFLALVIFFVVEFSLVISSITSQMSDTAGRTAQIDVIWPIIGVLLSYFVNFSVRVTAKIERTIRMLGSHISLHKSP